MLVSELLQVAEMFHSLQGEGIRMGLPTVFLRLTGCNLRCSYCDTEFAQQASPVDEELSVRQILERISRWDCREVMVTGGEPLLHENSPLLLRALQDKGYRVSLETNGSIDLGVVPAGVSRSVDIKTPGSGEQYSFLPANLKLLNRDDQLKFICVDRADLDWAVAFARQHNLTDRCPVFLQPARGLLSLNEAADSIVASGLPFRLGLQLHKMIWGEDTRGV